MIAHQDRTVDPDDLIEIQVQQGGPIRPTILECFIHTPPLTAKGGAQREFGKRLHLPREQHRIAQFEQRVARWTQGDIDRLTKRR